MEAGAASAPGAATVERAEAQRGGPGRRFGGRLIDAGLNVYAGLALLYLLLPIAIIILFSFNDPVGRFNFIWQGFTLDAWKSLDY